MLALVSARTDPGELASYPELDITPEWGSLVRRARTDRGMTQVQLAELIGITQAQLSYIEQGITRSTKAVIPLCDALGIPRPDHYFSDELEKRWVLAGRALRANNEAAFEALLHAAEKMIPGRES